VRKQRETKQMSEQKEAVGTKKESHQKQTERERRSGKVPKGGGRVSVGRESITTRENTISGGDRISGTAARERNFGWLAKNSGNNNGDNDLHEKVQRGVDAITDEGRKGQKRTSNSISSFQKDQYAGKGGGP